MRHVFLAYLKISISLVRFHSSIRRIIAMTMAVTVSENEISTSHSASTDTGTDINKRKVVMSAEKPMDFLLSFLRVRNRKKKNAKKGAKIKIAAKLCMKAITLFQPPSKDDRTSAKSAVHTANVLMYITGSCPLPAFFRLVYRQAWKRCFPL